jgi:tetrahydromethanopterin S-methyltransferase subunit G
MPDDATRGPVVDDLSEPAQRARRPGSLRRVSQPSEIEARLTAVEARVEEAAADAAAARHLAAARDRDLGDLAVKVDANRSAINALGVQTAARFDRLEGRVDRLERKVDEGFADVRSEMRAGFAAVDDRLLEVRGLLDRTAAFQERTAELLDRLIAQRGPGEIT